MASLILKSIFLIALLDHQLNFGQSQCITDKNILSTSYQIDTGSKYMEVACDQQIDNGRWTVVMHRFSGQVAFHGRTKDEYKSGFGNYKNGEYFIGLDALSALTNERQMELLFVVTDKYNDTSMYKYSEFRLGYSLSEYRVVSHGSYEGAMQYDGGFGDLDSCRFDFTAKPSVGWRIKAGGGSCWHSNIFGQYTINGFNAKTDLCWGSYAYCVQVKELRMLVRPVNAFIKGEAKDY